MCGVLVWNKVWLGRGEQEGKKNRDEHCKRLLRWWVTLCQHEAFTEKAQSLAFSLKCYSSVWLGWPFDLIIELMLHSCVARLALVNNRIVHGMCFPEKFSNWVVLLYHMIIMWWKIKGFSSAFKFLLTTERTADKNIIVHCNWNPFGHDAHRGIPDRRNSLSLLFQDLSSSLYHNGVHASPVHKPSVLPFLAWQKHLTPSVSDRHTPKCYWPHPLHMHT